MPELPLGHPGRAVRLVLGSRHKSYRHIKTKLRDSASNHAQPALHQHLYSTFCLDTTACIGGVTHPTHDSK